MRVDGYVVVFMLQDYHVAIAPQPSRKNHPAIACGTHRSSWRGRDVDSIVHHPISHAEWRGDCSSRDRPFESWRKGAVMRDRQAVVVGWRRGFCHLSV